jgi:hypothetical protein
LVPHIAEIGFGLWPTLCATGAEAKNLGSNKRFGPKSLIEVARSGVPLPALTRKGNYNRRGCSRTSGDGLATVVGGSLNPTWCEWLQGFPLGWTEVE